MTTAEKIRAMIDESNLTQKAFAEKAGIRPTTLNSILKNDTKNIKLDTLRGICEAFGVTLDYLMDDTVVDKEEGKYWDLVLTGPEGRLITNYRRLDAHGRRIVDIIVDEEVSRVELVAEEKAKKKAVRSLRVIDNPLVEGELVQYVPFRVSVQKASAGTGVALYPDDFITEYVADFLIDEEAEFGIPVYGDSMEPQFVDGEILVVGKDLPRVGEVGVFIMEGEGYVKVRGDKTLISLNEKYDPIPMDESIRCVGKVIGSLDPEVFEAWHE